jgi:hypothetical protein
MNTRGQFLDQLPAAEWTVTHGTNQFEIDR